MKRPTREEIAAEWLASVAKGYPQWDWKAEDFSAQAWAMLRELDAAPKGEGFGNDGHMIVAGSTRNAKPKKRKESKR